MENELTPQMALTGCDNTCSFSKLYRKLKKAVGNIKK